MTPSAISGAFAGLDVQTGMDNPSAPRGKSERYARRELERRFLLAAPPEGPVERTTYTFDRYLEGTRLRLRKKTDETGTHCKLTQKVPASPRSLRGRWPRRDA